MLCDLFTIVGQITTKTGGKDLNLCGFYLILLNPSVEKFNYWWHVIPLKAAQLLPAASF